jgi:outer membrane murein-binding lipoprotein Lpp
MIERERSVARLSVVAMAVLGGLSLSACATREYVDQQIDIVNTHLSAVDAKASAADQKADQALNAAEAAQAGVTQTNQRIDSLTATVNGLQQAPPPPPRRTPRG